jgi:hypothetical protein
MGTGLHAELLLGAAWHLLKRQQVFGEDSLRHGRESGGRWCGLRRLSETALEENIGSDKKEGTVQVKRCIADDNGTSVCCWKINVRLDISRIIRAITIIFRMMWILPWFECKSA